MAAKYGNYVTATCLCDNDASVNLEDEDGMTALHYAAMSGNYKICSLLASRGAKLNIKNTKGESAARVAFRMGNTKCLEVLCATQYFDEQNESPPR